MLLESSFCSHLHRLLSSRLPLYLWWVNYHCLTALRTQPLLRPRMAQAEARSMDHLIWILEHLVRAPQPCWACTSLGLSDRRGLPGIGLSLIVDRVPLLVFPAGCFCNHRPGSYRMQSRDRVAELILPTLDAAIKPHWRFHLWTLLYWRQCLNQSAWPSSSFLP